MISLLAAISFLTRIPTGRWMVFDEKQVARSAAWFPFVGALIGALCALVAALLRGRVPWPMTAVAVLIIETLITGALHLDGLADTADGFGGGKDRDDILRIMRDHAIGSYGGAAISLLIALKLVAYSGVLQRTDWLAAVIVTPSLGRWSLLLLTAGLPYARSTSSPARQMGKAPLFVGTVMIVVLLVAVRLARAWAAAAAAVAVTVVFGLYCRRRIGGITGDTLGANLELCESAALVLFVWATRA
jgi:cobalamin 5'-phosphate synthase/cobalamin synthase